MSFLQNFLSQNNSNPSPPQQGSGSPLPQDFVKQFYSKAPEGFRPGYMPDFIKLCFSNVGMLLDMYKKLKSSGTLNQVETAAKAAINDGRVSQDQVGQIQSAINQGSSVPGILGLLKNFF